ncbi:MAG: RNA polymerase sigma factor [Planctomycetes bacterium]|nr:RNA polymerase sigma factor [Planctomycetota bacterium]MCB9920433.1 RNA polymerase sigma factor [Planctomycetota bacterium]
MTAPNDDWAVPREEAVPRLLDMHGGRIYGLARRLCGNPEEADDLVQEVFLQAWRKWHQFRGDADPRIWLFTIARHACQRMHRKRSGEPDRLDSLDELLPFGQPRIAVIPSDVDELDQHVRRDQQELVGRAITTLPPDFRMALILKDIVGFSVEEVSEILGIPQNTVKTRVHRARLKVRDALADGLPKRELPEPAYSKQVCLDLLDAKQEALDRGTQMPNADEIICERCLAVFATLDLSTDVCRALRAHDVIPAELRQKLEAALHDDVGAAEGD